MLLSAPSKLDGREGTVNRAYRRPQLLLRKMSRIVHFITSKTKSPLSAEKEFPACLAGISAVAFDHRKALSAIRLSAQLVCPNL